MLNNQQKNSIANVFSQAEEGIIRALDLMNEKSKNKKLQQLIDNIPEEVRGNVKAHFHGMLNIIDEISDKYDLKPEKTDVKKKVLAEISVMWSNLHDIKSDKLIRYGDVDPSIENELDPCINKLIEMIERLRQILGYENDEE